MHHGALTLLSLRKHHDKRRLPTSATIFCKAGITRGAGTGGAQTGRGDRIRISQFPPRDRAGLSRPDLLRGPPPPTHRSSDLVEAWPSEILPPSMARTWPAERWASLDAHCARRLPQSEIADAGKPRKEEAVMRSTSLPAPAPLEPSRRATDRP